MALQMTATKQSLVMSTLDIISYQIILFSSEKL